MDYKNAIARLYERGVSELDPKRDYRGRVKYQASSVGRGFVKVQYGEHVIKFWPVKHWPTKLGVSYPTCRKWLRLGLVNAFERYGMPVMSMAELEALRKVSDKYARRECHDAFHNAEFSKEAIAKLIEVRDVLQRLQLKLPLTGEQRHLIMPSLEETSC